MDDGAANLFGSGSESNSNDSSTIPDSWQKLSESSAEGLKKDYANADIMVNKFYTEFSDRLETGKGRDRLVEYVFKHVNGDYDISVWNSYDEADVVDLSVYLLDELDREGEMLGKEVFNYVEEFVLEEGEPEFLKEIEY